MTLTGCYGRPGPDYAALDLANVSGVVTLDGAPLSGARVEFVEADVVPGRSCFGETDSQGAYTIYRVRGVEGCLPGEMKIQITTSRAQEGESASSSESKIPARYNSKTELRETVDPNGSHRFEFDLVSRAP